MNTIINPPKDKWLNICRRPEITSKLLKVQVEDILKTVKRNKDHALHVYNERFDKVKLSSLSVSEEELKEANNQVSKKLKNSIQLAYNNIYKFHESQKIKEVIIETSPGVFCWRQSVGIEKVGLYIPGGSAPLFSSVLMLGIPALIAQCSEIIICTPPNKEGKVNPAILYTANLLGINKIFKTGGAQAIGAMAYGTESIPRVDKIFGPGNQYVTKAKELVQLDGIAIDMPAGPSEVLVIADETANPDFVAADLLSQAEHGEDSQVILLSDSINLIKKVNLKLLEQLQKLPKKDIAMKALENSFSILLNDLEECFDFSNQYAPEHLIINCLSPQKYASKIRCAGSVFLGCWSCESAGDYASGTNHTLPTNGFARNYSGLSLDDYVIKITYQQVTEKGIKIIGKAIELMAEEEQLIAHKNAVTIRLNTIQ
jgi:histidinol dehydrogenase